jgi:tetratricopeptide (TPR) repeat protein
MSPSQRQAALADAQTFPESPRVLQTVAWELVKLPGQEMSQYRRALRCSEAACQLLPEKGRSLKKGRYLITLGMAHSRVGNYKQALETLLRTYPIQRREPTEGRAAVGELAFLAMTQQRLGHAREAKAYLQRLRELVSPTNPIAEAQGFLREAEALLAKPKTPGPR